MNTLRMQKNEHTHKTILVTGGAGFIGSALAARLVRDGHTVLVIDNFNDYYDPELKRARERALLSGVEVHNGDITDATFVDALFQKHSIDVVCHCAAQAGVRYSVEHPSEYVLSNVLGTQVLFEAMSLHKVRQMVFASTSSAYGMHTEIPFNEAECADRPVSVYAATKRAGELLGHSYHHQYGIEVTCLRFFTVYGPWSRPDMAMLKFAQQIERGEAIDVYNNGDMRRDFTYIDDIVQGFVLAVQKPLGYEVINLGNGSPVPLLTFIEVLEKALGRTAKRNLLPMQQGDVYETYADVTKAKALLGFEANIHFEQGVQYFVQWYKEYYKK